jgi:hypothetical protein
LKEMTLNRSILKMGHDIEALKNRGQEKVIE